MTGRFYPYERRSSLRFRVEGAMIELSSGGSMESSSQGPRKADVVNISTGGVSFRSNESMSLGAICSFTLLVPGRKPMRLTGRVKWRGQGPKAAGYVYGVEFARFGSAPGDNPPDIEGELKALEDEALARKTQ